MGLKGVHEFAGEALFEFFEGLFGFLFVGGFVLVFFVFFLFLFGGFGVCVGFVLVVEDCVGVI